MAIAGGIDGCRGGWLCVTWDTSIGRVEARILSALEEVRAFQPRADILGVDIPIGLPDRGPRPCDQEARRRLGRPRGSSVFPAPIRPMLRAGSYEEACRIGREAEGRALSIEAWGIMPKILQADIFLSAQPSRQDWIREVHPELSFWCWNGKRAMAHNKKTPRAGRRERRSSCPCLETCFPRPGPCWGREALHTTTCWMHLPRSGQPRGCSPGTP